jgi:FMN-dependent oxidoreductase (nitrilotriacetate monooxygenase family)
VGYRFYGPEFYQDVARIASRGKLDMIFFGDAAETPENHGGDYRAAVEMGFRWPKHDMSTMIPLMAQASYGLGFGLTVNTTYQHPFHVARLMSSLDWVTGGRMAWNAVTGAYKNEAMNWGFDGLPDTAERYRKSREHMEVVTGLWDTIEPDVLVLDREARRFGDAGKVHLLNHEGEFYNVRGPLPALPSPQGRPIIVQAGQSPDGMDLAATFADMQFTVRTSLPDIRKHRQTLDERLIAHGRSPRDLGCWWVVHYVVGESKNDAYRKRREIMDDLGSEFGLMMLSAQFGLDFSAVHPDATLSEVAVEVQKQKGHFGSFVDIVNSQDVNMTIGEYAIQRVVSEPLVIGSPKDIADQLEERHEAGDANGGFMLVPNYEMPGELSEFVDLVVPELQRRGLFKREYAGSTLRENLMA